MRLVNALGVRVAVVQAGLTLVGTSWIKQLDAELIKLHPGLARNIEKRSENQLLVQSPRWKPVKACLCKFCDGRTQPQRVVGTVPMRCHGRAGGIFAASQPLDTNVKNIRKDTRFDLPFSVISRRITRAIVKGCACLPAGSSQCKCQ